MSYIVNLWQCNCPGRNFLSQVGPGHTLNCLQDETPILRLSPRKKAPATWLRHRNPIDGFGKKERLINIALFHIKYFIIDVSQFWSLGGLAIANIFAANIFFYSHASPNDSSSQRSPPKEFVPSDAYRAQPGENCWTMAVLLRLRCSLLSSFWILRLSSSLTKT